MTRRPISTTEPVPPVATAQAGVFTRQQALDAGWTRAQVDHRMRTGVWRRFAGRALASAELGPWRWTEAWAVHLTWPDAVGSHLSAARAHGFPVPDGPAHATTASTVRTVANLVVHRVPLPEKDVVRPPAGGPLVTSPRRTAVDCLRILSAEDGAALYAWCVTRDVLSREDVRRSVVEEPGRHGNRALLRLLDATASGALSPAERRFHAMLRRAGLTGWVPNAPVVVNGCTVAVVDVLFPERRVVVEIDGWAAHGDRDSFERDRRRQNALVNAGFTVLRFTWTDLTTRPDAVVAEIRATLAPSPPVPVLYAQQT